MSHTNFIHLEVLVTQEQFSLAMRTSDVNEMPAEQDALRLVSERHTKVSNSK